MRKSSNKVIKRNQKIALLRGDRWKRNLKKGWLDSQMNPTQLKIARVAQDLSQTDTANKLGLSLSTYGGIERGKRSITTGMASLLASLLKLPVNKLFKQSSGNKLKAV